MARPLRADATSQKRDTNNFSGNPPALPWVWRSDQEKRPTPLLFNERLYCPRRRLPVIPLFHFIKQMSLPGNNCWILSCICCELSYNLLFVVNFHTICSFSSINGFALPPFKLKIKTLFSNSLTFKKSPSSKFRRLTQFVYNYCK